MTPEEIKPCVKTDKGNVVLIVASSKEGLDRAMERYFRDIHPAKHLVEIEDGPFEKDGTWKVFLRKSKCR